MLKVHGTCVQVHEGGVLLTGPSGSGKSDLALRLIDGGALLVGDDLVAVSASEQTPERLIVRTAQDRLAGLLEVRGLGIMRVPAVESAVLDLVIQMVTADAVERLPGPEWMTMLGRSVACLRLAPFEASAAAKVRLAAATARAGALWWSPDWP